jgi:uncharacterized membrane protein YphA (DoxX/SURF4 family)
MSFLKNPWVTFAVSLVLGGTFLYSSYHKIVDPPDFAKIVYNYNLVPGTLINLVTIYMPWFEVVAGLAVITSIGRRGGALGLGLICIVFIAALSYNLYRGHPTICGCFSTFKEGETLTEAGKFAKMRQELFIDVGLLLASVQILWATCCCKVAGKPK